MQTSKKKPLFKFICFLIGFGLVNWLITFILTPFCTSSTEMWDKYRAYEKGGIDTIYVGTSACYEGIDPSVVDEITGYSSYNMGSNAESLRQSKRAINAAIADHQIQRVVLALDETLLQEGKEQFARPEAAFIQAQNRGQGSIERIKNDASYLFNEKYFGAPDSINFWFPWTYNRIKDFKSFKKELKVKFGMEEMEMQDWNNIREEDGFKPFKKKIDYNKIKSVSSINWKESLMSEKGLGYLDDVINLCNENDVELIIIAPPYPTSVVLSCGYTYAERSNFIKAWLEERNQTYYDFNMAKESLYEKKSEYFKDWDHNNKYGAKAFSEALGEFLLQYEKGEGVESEFYSWSDYLDTIDYIDSVVLKLKSTPGEGIYLNAGAYTALSDVEYKFQIYDKEKKKYITIRDYNRTPSMTYTPEKEGNYKFRVMARKIGSNEKYDRYHVTSANYYQK
jgi:hypothetical protein